MEEIRAARVSKRVRTTELGIETGLTKRVECWQYMNAPAQPKRAWFQISLATGFLLMIEAAAIILICVRSEPWIPLAGPLTRAQMELRYGCWIAYDATSDGTRLCRRAPWMAVSITYADGETFSGVWEGTLPCGFLDDETLLTTSYTLEAASSPKYWLWRKRFPNFWWADLYRPEVWLAIVLGVLILWRAVRFIAGRRATWRS